MGFDPEKITFFAKTDARGQQVPFGIKAKDRQRHMYVIGKTGMGKSTLLENMAAQDIMTGEGMAFIDPHGSAAETLLDYIPEHRVNDVIYFAPFDTDNPISFNVMEDVGPDKRHLVVSGLMSTFKKIWVDAWSARMEYILTNALLALIEYPDTTLLSVNRLFSDKGFRTKVVDYIKDPAVKSFWVDEFANYTERFAAEALPAIQNKIGQFTGNPLIRNIIGQPKSSFDIRQLMDEKKILIMNLSKGLIGETNANLLGSMLTTRIYLAAMSRADLPVAQMKQMPNFYFYVDEFQSFANSTFANILSEARKYHLNLIIAHQYIAQMEEEVRDAVFGNVGTTIAFRVGPLDAEFLEPVFTPRFLAADVVNLGFAQIYLTLMIDGIGSQPFSATTLPPLETPPVSCKQMVIAASRKNFTRPRAEVEEMVQALHMSQSDAMEKQQNKENRPRPNNNGNNNNRGNGGNNNGNQRGNHNGGSGGQRTNDQPPQRAEGGGSERRNHNGQSNDRADRRPDRGSNGGNGDRVERRNDDRPGRGNDGDRKQKPPNNQKSLDELRSILGSISSKQESQAQPPHESKKPADLVEQPTKQVGAYNNLHSQPHGGETRSAEQQERSREKPAQPKKTVDRSFERPVSRPDQLQQSNGHFPQPTVPTPQPNNTPVRTDKAIEPAAKSDLKGALQELLQKSSGSPNKTQQTSAPSPSHSSPAPATTAPATAATPVSNTEQAGQPAASNKNTDDPLSPQVIKKMLRTQGSARTPYES